MKNNRSWMVAGVLAIAAAGSPVRAAQQTTPIDYRVLATTKTSTMEKELNETADVGFRFATVMGGETAVGGKEVVCIVSRLPGESKPRFRYKLLATNRTSTMEREINDAAEIGYQYRGQTVFESVFGGKEVVSIFELDRDHPAPGAYQYRLLATTRTSTMQKELQQAGADGFEAVGLTLGKTALGGTELVTILKRSIR